MSYARRWTWTIILLMLCMGTRASSQDWYPIPTQGEGNISLHLNDGVLWAGGYYTTDGGYTWQTDWFNDRIYTGELVAAEGDTILTAWQDALRIGPNEGQVLYSGIGRYTDSGRKFADLNFTGMVNAVIALGNQKFLALMSKPGDMRPSEVVSSMYLSTNGGTSWEGTGGGNNLGSYRLGSDNHVSTDGKGTVLCAFGSQVYVSVDTGQLWNVSNLMKGSVASVHDKSRFASAESILWYTENGGVEVHSSPIPESAGLVRSMCYVDSSTILIGGDSGLVRFNISRGQWVDIGEPEPIIQRPQGDAGTRYIQGAIVEVHVNKGNIVVVTEDHSTLISPGNAVTINSSVHVSPDGGETWSLAKGLELGWISTFVELESAGLVGRDSYPVMRDPWERHIGQFYSSENEGESWSNREGYNLFVKLTHVNDNILIRSIAQTKKGEAVIGGREGMLYVFGDPMQVVPIEGEELKNIYRVVGVPDGRWYATDTSGKSYHGYCLDKNNIAWEEKYPRIDDVEQVGQSRYVAISGKDVYYTEDAGEVWELQSSHDEQLLRVDAFEDGTITLITPESVMLSSDTGISWIKGERISDDGSRRLKYTVVSFIVEPNTILVGANNPDSVLQGARFSAAPDSSDLFISGLFRSDDRGLSWYRWEEGLSSNQVHGLAATTDGRILCAATRKLYLTDSLMSESSVVQKEKDHGQLAVVFDNSTESIVISHRTSIAGRYTYLLSDVVGRQIDMIAADVVANRKGIMRLEAPHGASGMYVVCVRLDGEQIHCEPIIITKR